MLKQNTSIKSLSVTKGSCISLLLLLWLILYLPTPFLYGDHYTNGNFKTYKAPKEHDKRSEKQTLTYYLDIAAFAQSFISIPTSNLFTESSTISSTYLAGRAAIYDEDNKKVGTCSASFLCMQTEEGIYTDISNFLSVDSGLIVSWFTPTTLINLELDSIIHSMVTECMVTASTKVGINPFYGQTFDLVVSSDNKKIYFQFTRTGTIF